jgi:hypothetical protein
VRVHETMETDQIVDRSDECPRAGSNAMMLSLIEHPHPLHQRTC